ncbi:MAG TPA: hypothetical protein VK404_08805, partial [Spirosoma sp.]|nr:hypothetical protein [Spirosoma sp.]
MIHTLNICLASVRPLIWLVAILLTASSLVGCAFIRKLVCGNEPPHSKPGNAQTPPPNSVNLTLSGSITDAEIKSRLVASFNPAKFDTADIVVRHCKCDTGLINIALPNSFTIVIEGAEGPLAVRTGGGATGGDVDLPFSGNGANFRLSPIIPTRDQTGQKPNYEVSKQIDVRTYDPNRTVSVAVFDTGLDPFFLPSTTWQQSTTQCASTGPPTTPSLTGWNFTTDG